MSPRLAFQKPLQNLQKKRSVVLNFSLPTTSHALMLGRTRPHSTEAQNTCLVPVGKCLLMYFLPATAVTVAAVIGGYLLVPWSGVRSVVSAPARILALGSDSLAAPPPGPEAPPPAGPAPPSHGPRCNAS